MFSLTPKTKGMEIGDFGYTKIDVAKMPVGRYKVDIIYDDFHLLTLEIINEQEENNTKSG